MYAPRTWPRTPICFMTSEARRSAPIKAHIGALAYNIIALLFIWLSQNILTCWDDFFCGHVHHTVEDFWWYCLLPQTHEWVCNRGQSYDFFIVCFFFSFSSTRATKITRFWLIIQRRNGTIREKSLFAKMWNSAGNEWNRLEIVSLSRMLNTA